MNYRENGVYLVPNTKGIMVATCEMVEMYGSINFNPLVLCISYHTIYPTSVICVTLNASLY